MKRYFMLALVFGVVIASGCTKREKTVGAGLAVASAAVGAYYKDVFGVKTCIHDKIDFFRTSKDVKEKLAEEELE